MNYDKNAPVAVFDSGAGGIAVLRAIRSRLPRENLLYFGDSAMAPYGERRAEEVRRLAIDHADTLLVRAKALVIACNTATAVAAKEIRERHEGTIVIGMEPALRSAVNVAREPRVLVMATELTLREGRFSALAAGFGSACTVLPLCAPEIIRLVERGEESSLKMLDYIGELLAPYRATPPDAVVLGCTHFCFVREAIANAIGRDVPIFDGVTGTVGQLIRRLSAAELLREEPSRGVVTMTSSDSRALPLFARLLFME